MATVLASFGWAALLTANALAISEPSPHRVQLQPLGSYASGIFNAGAAEIVAHDPKTQYLFVVNASNAVVDVLSIAQPSAPKKVGSIDVKPYGAVANSVAVHDGIVAVAVENVVKTDPGTVVFFDRKLALLNRVTVGALPDMLTFSPNGRYVLVANEGEPNSSYTSDPLGTVSIIDLWRGVKRLRQSDVHTVDFTAFNGATLDPSVRIFGPGATVAQDIEPEYIAVSSDSRTAWVTCQENNAIAIIDIRTATVKKLVGLGFKDHSLVDAAANLYTFQAASLPPIGTTIGGQQLFLGGFSGLHFEGADPATGNLKFLTHTDRGPNAIASYSVGWQTFLVTANEGDAREYVDEETDFEFIEAVRVGSGSVVLDTNRFPNAAVLKNNSNLGRLNITSTLGKNPTNGLFEALYSFGARSFSIWNAKGEQVFDSGDDLEQITALAYPTNFNASNSGHDFDNRSDDKGPEPEGVVIGKAYGRTYAFIGMERIGGVAVYDIGNPRNPMFVNYANFRNFSTDVTTPEAGDLGPEGLIFISQEDSPNRRPSLVVGNEISGTTTLYEITLRARHDDGHGGSNDGGQPGGKD